MGELPEQKKWYQYGDVETILNLEEK